jgi:diguanylate cyclase (GGDEF)-like protein
MLDEPPDERPDESPAADAVPEIRSWDEIVPWIEEHHHDRPKEKTRLLKMLQPFIQACVKLEARVVRLRRWLGLQRELIRKLRKNLSDAGAYYENMIARLLEELTRDPMTGLMNRAAFQRRFIEFFLFQQEPTTVALLIFDVNRFKMINDMFGHAVGDKVILRVAEILRQGVRSEPRENSHLDRYDVVARLGGDEFAILIPDATMEIALSIAQRHSRAFNQTDWASLGPIAEKPANQGKFLASTLAIGVLVIDVDPLKGLEDAETHARHIWEDAYPATDGLAYLSKSYEKNTGVAKIFSQSTSVQMGILLPVRGSSEQTIDP